MAENKRPIVEVAAELKDKIESWQSGDLLLLAGIERSFSELKSNPECARLPRRLRNILDALSKETRDLLKPLLEKTWIVSSGRFIDALLSFLGGSAPKEDDEEEENIAPPSASPLSHYTEQYFANIIEDPKMLAQLCEEVKGHLDNAQFALVDLEYDPSNAEHINKTFRAFHTIKSSAAFLGLKNIEEVAHSMEDLFVLVRDGKLRMVSELTDVVFYGIGLLKDLVLIIETSNYSIPVMTESFRRVDITSYIDILKRILSDYQTKKIGEILIEDGKLDRPTVDKILEHQKSSSQKFGVIAVEENLISPSDFNAALLKQEAATHKKASYVKVSNERLNALIDIVGELVVNQSILRQDMAGGQAEKNDWTIAQLESITTSIKNLVLSMGMVPITEIFNKLRVVVRNTAADTGKTVTVNFSGEDTELDRNVIENIYDPLVHIVRNSVDHGIEDPAVRESLGKPRLGKILISAEHKGSGIEISVADDGSGIDLRRVTAKAIERGLLTEDSVSSLTERDILSFIFQPGFSTAAKVTEVSGRGVGLDVVKRNIEQIHGKVDVLTDAGKGTRFVIRIPLTLAIIDGFVTVVDDSKYIFPFTLIEEIIVPAEQDVSILADGSVMLLNRGSYMPIIFASDVFHHERPAESAETAGVFADRLTGKLVMVISYEHRNYGIAVDSTIGKQEIVIKNLSHALDRVKTFSGGTIFGDGTIGFVVDIEEFMASARKGLIARE